MCPDEEGPSCSPGSLRFAVGFVLVLTVVAGCLGSGQGDERGEAQGDREGDIPFRTMPKATHNLLSPEGNEIVLVEVVPTVDGPLAARLQADLPIGPSFVESPTTWATEERPGPCAALWAQGRGGPSFAIFPSPGRYGASASEGSEGVNARTAWPFGERADYDPLGAGIEEGSAGDSIPFVFGLDDVKAWRETDASAEVTVEGNGTLRWRIVDQRSMTCETRLAGWSQGTYMQTCCVGGPANRVGIVTVAEDLTEPVPLDRAGQVWVDVGANDQYHLRLDGPNGTLVERQHSELEELHSTMVRVACLPAGDYQLTVKSLHGTGDAWARFAYAEIPAWMQDIPGEDRGRFIETNSDGTADFVSVNRC